MTTDITVLAQRLKVAAKNGCCHTLFPDDCLALVEALEKSEKTSEARREAIDITHKRVARERDRANAAEEALEKAQAQSSKWLEAYHKAVSIGARYEEHIAELESRTVTVKLPDIMPPEAAPAHYWGSGESMAYADGYNKSAADLKTSFAQACSSAGVNVEFE